MFENFNFNNTWDGPVVPLMGLDIINSDSEFLEDYLISSMKSLHKVRACFINAHCSNVASHNKRYMASLRTSDIIIPDGSGIKIAFKLNNVDLIENLNGTDFIPKLCNKMSKEKLSVFLLGGKPDIAQLASERLISDNPGLIIAGCHHGYIDNDADKKEIIDQINNSGASLLLVAMGVPLQDIWLKQNANSINVPVVMGVGGLFDFLSGRISRAPLFLRNKGLEWIWRFIQEPGRMWKRYIIGNPYFIARILLSFLNKSQTLKRLIDITASFTLLMILMPILALCAICIKVSSRGPFLFKQIRVGLDGKEFTIYKLRSMYADADTLRDNLEGQNKHGEDILFKIKKDPRITPVGAFLRKTSLDELPQLFNVINGTMSLVGPRPHLPREVALYKVHHNLRLQVKPGITCFWQVSGRANLAFNEQYKLDIEYINRRSFVTDIRILLHTPLAVIQAEGAY